MDAKLKEKRWTKEAEKAVYSEWKEKEVYCFQEKSKKPVYSIDTPPPYVNTPVHIGHATTYTLMDMFARFKRMQGFNVLFPLGLDRNGLPIEMAAEKKFGISTLEMPREEFIKKCEKMLEESTAVSTDSFARLGISFNSWKTGEKIGDVYMTDSKEYRTLTQNTFIDLYNKGLIYEGTHLTSYCPGCRTTIADSEIEYEDKPAMLNDVDFTVKGTGEKVTIATTRPELLCTSALVIFHPDDGRYKKLEGKRVVVPIYNIEVPVKAHPQADPEFGTGLLFMSKSAGDQNAVRFLREMNIAPEMAVDKNGRIKRVGGFLQGLKTEEARMRIVEELKKIGMLRGQKQIMHRTPICERSKHVIDYIMLPELYLKQIEFKKDLIGLAKKLRFFADSSRQILIDWINSLTIDWPISRNRYYATEIPLWHCRKCRAVIVPEKGRYYQPWRQPCPVKKCKKCGSSDFEGDKRVLDTWFDSSNSPLYILKYGINGKFFLKNVPCTLRPQGREIIRTWLYYTLLKDYLLTGKLIFRDVWINYYVVDEKGKKMSKSKGNVVEPQEILDKHGAEPFRLWCAVEGDITTGDFRCSFERIEGAGKTIIKLWNIARFISMFERSKRKAKPTPLDDWIRHEVNMVVKTASEKYEQYDFHYPIQNIKHFMWQTFASHYLELVKSRAYNKDNSFTKEEQNAAVETLYYCLEKLLLVMAPVVPMITYSIYKKLYGKDIHFEKFASVEKIKTPCFSGDELEELNKAIWKKHTEQGLSLKTEIKEAVLPEKFKPIESDLKAAHSIEKVSYGKELRLTF